MFNCEKCWENPCICGHEYRDKSSQEMAKFIYCITSYHDREEVLQELMKIMEPLTCRVPHYVGMEPMLPGRMPRISPIDPYKGINEILEKMNDLPLNLPKAKDIMAGTHYEPCYFLPEGLGLIVDGLELGRLMHKRTNPPEGRVMDEKEAFADATMELIKDNKAVVTMTGPSPNYEVHDWIEMEKQDPMDDLLDFYEKHTFNINKLKEDWILDSLNQNGYKYITELFKDSSLQKLLIKDAKIRLETRDGTDYLYAGQELLSTWTYKGE